MPVNILNINFELKDYLTFVFLIVLFWAFPYFIKFFKKIYIRFLKKAFRSFFKNVYYFFEALFFRG